jgi:hypothetical protein
MKLYKFEEYYLYLLRYKVIIFLKKVLSTDAGLTISLIVLFFITLLVASFILGYFLTGVDVFLMKNHLKEPLMQRLSSIKPYLEPFLPK